VDVKIRLLGEWEDDKRNREGTCTYANGDTYKGEWKNDKRHGLGTYTYKESGTQVIFNFVSVSLCVLSVQRYSLQLNSVPDFN
jgi:hypothetical protein